MDVPEDTGRGSGLLGLLLALGAGYLGLGAWNRAVARRTRDLPFPAPLPGERATYNWSEGAIAYTRQGQGEPLLLVHGVYAGADSYEFHQVFAPLAARNQVYAYDLLGFGHSSRPRLDYTGTLYVRLLVDFVRQVIGRPVTVVATSLSAGHALVAATQEPRLIRRLILEAPTGRTRTGSPLAASLVYAMLTRVPQLGEGLRNLIATRVSIRSYLRQQAYYNPASATPEMVEHDYVSAHQPGGQYPLIAFLTGRLNAPAAEAARHTLQPLTLLWGQYSRVTPVTEAQRFLDARPDAQLVILPEAGLDAINDAPDRFVQQVQAAMLQPAAEALPV